MSSYSVTSPMSTDSTSMAMCSACSQARLRSNSSICASTLCRRPIEGHRRTSSDRRLFHPSSGCKHQSIHSPTVIFLVICLLVLDFTSFTAASNSKRNGASGLKIREVPVFTHLPPPIVYQSNFAEIKFKCSVYPKNANIAFLIKRPKDQSPTTIDMKESAGSATYEIAKGKHVPEENDYFCRAHTEFGIVISRPFRVISASIRPYSSQEPSDTLYFYKGNVAQVLCSIPKSYPTAEVKFLKDGVVVGNSAKYLTVKLPGRGHIALLIKEFSKIDVGNYSCKAFNHIINRYEKSKSVQKLRLKKPSSKFPVRFHRKYPYANKGTVEIHLREGDNITLYCLPEGAPIPQVKWYDSGARTNGLIKGSKSLPEFGAIQINSVRATTGSSITCTMSQGHNPDKTMDRIFKLIVKERLKITDPPRDQRVKKIGDKVELSCTASGAGGNIKTEWFFNGQLVRRQKSDFIVNATTLTVLSVTTDLMGVYQCIASTENEWTSATAAVLLMEDELRRGKETLYKASGKLNVKLCSEGMTAMLSCNITTEEEQIYDMEWYKGNVRLKTHSDERYFFLTLPKDNVQFINIMVAKLSDAGIYQCIVRDKVSGEVIRTEYQRLRVITKEEADRLQAKEWQPKNKPIHSGNSGVPVNNVIENTGERKGSFGGRSRNRGSKPRKKAGLSVPVVTTFKDDLSVKIAWNYTGRNEVESYKILYKRCNNGEVRYRLHDEQKCTNGEVVSNLQKQYYLISGSPLQAGYTIKFRIQAMVKVIGRNRRKLKKGPWSQDVDFRFIIPDKPKITKIQTISKTTVQLWWDYPTDGPERRRLSAFEVRYREQLGENSFGRYDSQRVEGPRSRSTTINDLKHGRKYQFLVYGIIDSNSHSPRLVTLFSDYVTATTMSQTLLPPGAKKAESNRVTFLIMGCVAGLLIVIVAVLMSICLWRQRKEKRRMRASAFQAALNGTSIDSNYKDPKFLVPGTNSASSQLLLSNLGDGTVWSQHHPHLGQGVPPLPHPRNNHMNGGVRLNPEAASLMLNYDDRFSPLSPPLPPTATLPTSTYYGNGTLRRESNTSRSMGMPAKTDGEPLYTTRGSEDPLYATRLHPAYAVTSPVGSIYPLPTPLGGPLGGPPGRFSPYAVAVPPMTAGGDGAESVYSYFSQQETGTHTDGPTPYTATRTVDRPRHHRRKRRRPTNNTSCSQSGMESGSETGAPHMKDMAVNTDMSSSDAIYESSIHASTTASPPPRMGALMMAAMTEIPGTVPVSYKSPPGAPDLPPPPPPVTHPILSTPLTSVASSSPSSSSGPPSSHTLTRRGTPNLFLDPPRVRDYQEYGVAVSPETGVTGGPVVPAV